jgi:hypothetical protein
MKTGKLNDRQSVLLIPGMPFAYKIAITELTARVAMPNRRFDQSDVALV